MRSSSSDSSGNPVRLLVWLVPLAALAVSLWLVLREYTAKGPVITVFFANGGGIHAGTTPLVHKGVSVGLVRSVALSEKFDGVVVEVELDPSAAPLAVEGSEFWIVHPEIGVSGVRGLETLLSGAQLKVRAGQGAPAKHFNGLAKPPAHEGQVSGSSFVLKTSKLGSLNPGSPVMYREVKVGAVASHRLADDATSVLVTIELFDPYQKLVRTNTKFWISGGLSMKVGLLGAQVHTNSLESLVVGGVSFATPDEGPLAPPAPESTVFDLAADGEKAWLKWEPKIDVSQAAH